MTVGGVRVNQREAINWPRLQVDEAQSVSPLSKRHESSSNDHLHKLIPAEEVSHALVAKMRPLGTPRPFVLSALFFIKKIKEHF
jgi:hypothetical protein